MKRRRFGFGSGYGHDPYRKALKATAARSRDVRQLALNFIEYLAKNPAARRKRKQIDLEEYIAGMGDKP